MSIGKHSIKNKEKIKLKKIILFLSILAIIILIIYSKKTLINFINTKFNQFTSSNDKTNLQNINNQISLEPKLDLPHFMNNDIEFNSFNIISKNSVSIIEATIINHSSSDIPASKATLLFLDNLNCEICELDITIDSIPANSTISFATTVTMDLSNAFDYKILDKNEVEF